MKKVIMDCDPGHDDAIALLLASRADDIELLGVTTVAGNSELENTTRNARKILDYAGVTDVDVYAGCSRPMMRDLYRLTGAIIHGEDGLGGPKLPDPVTPVKEEHGVDFIIRTLRESEEKIILIPTGPLTNIAMALIKAPDIKEKIERIIIMGGAVNDPGNITSAAEFNIYVDPEAAKIVFASGCNIYLNTLDISMKAVFYEEDIERLRAQGDKISDIVAKLLDFFSSTHVQHFGFKACPIHDALCVGVLIDENLIQYQKTYLDISVNDPLTLGETVADLWGITGHEPNCYLSVKVDRELFVQMIQEHMQKTYQSKK
ncbi:nucleoside hydrolase [Diplocloster agilis]|uniref:Nucleoside hydrolase n=1 Tax=Diplocloster agilis TaxID=2850323 RepID=A0A949NBX9_9FIRM|nr:MULTISPECIES: nucleoside hydrolase [Lachnospiraceae]MBU9738062.1 nucleoside hydrolase [Diplocloster agilis]MBU9746384.1 nucleoside hydrolase [Diplocloster agilis]MCU6734010.1 nucleoside hydrolase [Suonthocola fibrivorans]SCJ19243.1 Pyrimidine-specific ribonucleoside hydrolase rihA [uncultured Clostridium sp.]